MPFVRTARLLAAPSPPSTLSATAQRSAIGEQVSIRCYRTSVSSPSFSSTSAGTANGSPVRGLRTSAASSPARGASLVPQSVNGSGAPPFQRQ